MAKAGGDAKKKRLKSAATGSGGARRSLKRDIQEEADPQWRAWFGEVVRRRKALTNPKAKPFVRVNYEKDGAPATLSRRKADPVLLKNIIKSRQPAPGAKFSTDLALIAAAWKLAVGADIAESSAIHAFKNGVLSVDIFSSSLLQEIRQFHQEAIFADLRDIWTASVPLVKIVYRLGKR